MLTRSASTSFWTMGSMALFCRGSVTGWSIAYWKKSPNSPAVADDATPLPRSRSSTSHPCSDYRAVRFAIRSRTDFFNSSDLLTVLPGPARRPAVAIAAIRLARPWRRCRWVAGVRRRVRARRQGEAHRAVGKGPSEGQGRPETRAMVHVLPVLLGGVVHDGPALQHRLAVLLRGQDEAITRLPDGASDDVAAAHLALALAVERQRHRLLLRVVRLRQRLQVA